MFPDIRTCTVGPMMRPMSQKTISRAFMAFTALLLLGAVVLTIVKSSTADLDPATPEGVVQQLVTALFDHDHVAAEQLLAPTSRGCTRLRSDDEITAVTLEDVEVTGDRAMVEVEITRSSDSPFEPGWSSHGTFRLTRTDDGWRINEAPYSLCERW